MLPFRITIAILTLKTVHGTINLPGRGGTVDSRFGRWDKSSIFYCIDSLYTPQETSTINQAIATMSAAVPCLTFIPINCTDVQAKIRITPYASATSNILSAVSFSFPGRYNELAKNGTDQILGIARDAHGCSLSVRCVLKFLAVLLGKRNEHQRGDRDHYITVNEDSLVIPSTYRQYSTSEAYWQRFPYDYCSITHNQPTDYAIAGTQAFTVADGSRPGCIPMLETISNTDCRLISLMYQCDESLCPPLDCASQPCPTTSGSTSVVASATTGTTEISGTSVTTDTTGSIASGTTATTKEPLCPVNFCDPNTPKIDEASILYDSRYFMFSGDCAVHIDETGRIIGKSTKIDTIFPGVTGPVRSVWTDQMTGVTSVVTDTAQYACLASGCASITPMTATPTVRFEFAILNGTQFDAHNYAISAPGNASGDVYVNEQTLNQMPLSSIACAPAAASPSVPCKITGSWNAAYMIRGPSGFNVVAVIGMAGTSQFLQVMRYTGTEAAPDIFQFLTSGIPLREVLQCPP